MDNFSDMLNLDLDGAGGQTGDIWSTSGACNSALNTLYPPFGTHILNRLDMTIHQ